MTAGTLQRGHQRPLCFLPWAVIGWALSTVAWAPGMATAQLEPRHVLVLYNSQGPDTSGSGQSDSLDVFQYYQSARPGVLGFDLNEATLAPGNISYANYVDKIRTPLQDFLTTNELDRQVAVLTLTRGIPHRIRDINTPELGDQPINATDALTAGNATYVTVDSELTLLWQPLDENEANAAMDSFADNVVFNPYHNESRSILAPNRSRIARTKSFENLGNVAWRMQDSQAGPDTDAGNIYITSRLDGHSVDDVFQMIDRGRYPSYNQFEDLLLFDENDNLPSANGLDNTPLFANGNSIGHLGDDYDETAALFAPMYDKVLFNEDSKFLIGTQPFAGRANTEVVTDKVALLSSLGGNHGSDATGFVQTFTGQLSNGAIMNTLESFNAKQLGGLDGFSDQGQLADFIAAGGTFGIGQSWEPFAFSLPDNEVLLDNFLLGDLTWVESAWSSIPWLSWQQVVVGDPLSKATLILDPQMAVWNGTSSNSGVPGDGMTWSDADNWTRNSVVDTSFEHGDTVAFVGETNGAVNVDAPQIVQSLLFVDDFQLEGADLVVRSGEINVSGQAAVTIDLDLYSSESITKLGSGSLLISARAPDVIVDTGTLGGTGTVAGLVNADARVLPGTDGAMGTLTVNGNYQQDSDGRLAIQLDANGNHSQLSILGHAMLGGTIELIPLNQYQPPSERGDGQTAAILNASMVTGEFDSIWYDGLSLDIVSFEDNRLVGHVADGLFQIVSHGATEVELTSYLAMPGDANGDMMVDDADFAIWDAHRFTTGTSWISGDFNADGTTDVADFNIWNDNFGQLAPVAVPEFTGSHWALFCLSLLCCLSRRRFRHRRGN